MGKKINLDIKNKQLAEALNLGGLKEKLAKRSGSSKEQESKSEETKKKVAPKKKAPLKKEVPEATETSTPEEPPRRVKARAKSAFGEGAEPKPAPAPAPVEEEPTHEEEDAEDVITESTETIAGDPAPPEETKPMKPKSVRLGPTGRHVDDLLRKPKAQENKPETSKPAASESKNQATPSPANDANARAKGAVKEFRDFKPTRKGAGSVKSFDSRDRQGLRNSEDDTQRWRKRRAPKQKKENREDLTIRPTSLHVRIPITIKDLAAEMKLKASQLVQKLFMHGVILTLNDQLEDETTIQLIGHEFGCEITIDTSEEERIRITGKSIKEEIAESNPDLLKSRPPIVTFMGHVDHGKTSLIDAIRKSNRVAGEAGAITQHIGAFCCSTSIGDLTVLDTPGHEAFSAMRARGADATDIVVLVVAGDEGIRQQTVEAIQHAKAAGVTIIVAINKCDKPNFNADNIYRELSEQDLLPEAWGGQTITVNTSAVTGEGIEPLLEMLALQSEILELKANPEERARGTVLESEMHKGMGMVATVLIQNGTLRIGDCLVFGQHYGRVKTMRDEFAKILTIAPPSTPVEITGLSGLPEAGDEFIVVSSEKEARAIAEARAHDVKSGSQARKPMSLDTLMEEASDSGKKVLNAILRADVQGAAEALKSALQKIESDKIDLNIVATGVGEITESDVQLAAASKTIIVGFHTSIESNAADLAKQYGVRVLLHDIIYHIIDDVKLMMTGLLDKIPVENEMGKAEVRATFKSSQLGIIAGCIVTEGTINRNHNIRVVRNGEVIITTTLQSLKRVKDDVREVTKGVECGIVLKNFKDCQEGDILEAFEISYIKQEL